jgi:hypothetical protein
MLDMIAYLMRELGYLSGSHYNTNSTGTQVGGQYATLKKLGYTLSSHSAYTEDCEFTALANGIMLVDGYCSEVVTHGLLMVANDCNSM